MTTLKQAYRHWTNRGTFRLERDDVPGGRGIKMYLDDRYIGFQWWFIHASEAIANGDYDDKLGFSAASVGVPADFEKWIDPLDQLDRIKE